MYHVPLLSRILELKLSAEWDVMIKHGKKRDIATLYSLLSSIILYK